MVADVLVANHLKCFFFFLHELSAARTAFVGACMMPATNAYRSAAYFILICRPVKQPYEGPFHEPTKHNTITHQLTETCVESRCHIGADKWNQGPFWRPSSLVKYYEKCPFVGHLNINNHSSMERPNNIGRPIN